MDAAMRQESVVEIDGKQLTVVSEVLLEPEALRERLDMALYERNFLLEHLYHWPKIDANELYDRALVWGEKLAPYVDDVGVAIDRAMRDGKSVLLEGAQAAQRILLGEGDPVGFQHQPAGRIGAGGALVHVRHRPVRDRDLEVPAAAVGGVR